MKRIPKKFFLSFLSTTRELSTVSILGKQKHHTLIMAIFFILIFAKILDNKSNQPLYKVLRFGSGSHFFPVDIRDAHNDESLYRIVHKYVLARTRITHSHSHTLACTHLHTHTHTTHTHACTQKLISTFSFRIE